MAKFTRTRVARIVSAAVTTSVLAAFLLVNGWKWLHRKQGTHFVATIETKSVSFTFARWLDSDGIFVNDLSPVDLTLQTECSIGGVKSGKAFARDTLRGQTLTKVRILSMDHSDGVHATIDVDAGMLIFNFDSKQQLKPLKIQLAAHSLPPPGLAGLPRSEELTVTPKDGGQQFEFALRFRTRPEPQVGIPLQDGSELLFQKEGRSQLLPGTSLVAFRDPNRTRRSDFGLTIGALKGSMIESLATSTQRFEGRSPAEENPLVHVDHLSLRLSGTTGRLKAQDVFGADLVDVTPDLLDRWRPSNLSARAQGIGAILAVFATLLPFIWPKMCPNSKWRTPPPK